VTVWQRVGWLIREVVEEPIVYALSNVILRHPPTGMAWVGVMEMVSVDSLSVVVGEADNATPILWMSYRALHFE
jgi:hypothetical protein